MRPITNKTPMSDPRPYAHIQFAAVSSQKSGPRSITGKFASFTFLRNSGNVRQSEHFMDSNVIAIKLSKTPVDMLAAGTVSLVAECSMMSLTNSMVNCLPIKHSVLFYLIHLKVNMTKPNRIIGIMV